MSLLVNLYDSRSLSEAVNIIKTPEPFILSTLFNTVEPHDTDAIDYEEYRGSEEIASFAHADEPNPTNVKKETKQVRSFKLPRTYESKFFTAKELAKINALGQIYSQAAQRKAAQMDYVANELDVLKSRVIRLKEKMACEALATGKIVVAQDNISFDYDYNFTSDHYFTNTNAKLWSATTSDPLNDIRLWKKNVARRSGVSANILILGSSAAEAFIANEKVLKMLNNNNTQVGRIIGTQDATGSTTYLGTFAGVEVYEYHQSYVKAGNTVEMIPVDRAILVAKSRNMRLHYGSVDVIKNQVSVPVIAEYLLEVDEKNSNSRGIQWNLEQKSLPVIHDPGLVISAKVV